MQTLTLDRPEIAPRVILSVFGSYRVSCPNAEQVTANGCHKVKVLRPDGIVDILFIPRFSPEDLRGWGSGYLHT